jgi:hypothetical protein
MSANGALQDVSHDVHIVHDGFGNSAIDLDVVPRLT